MNKKLDTLSLGQHWIKNEIEKQNQRYFKTQRAREFFQQLELKYRAHGIIDEIDLYELLNDNERLSELVAKIKMKIFW